MSTPDEWRAIEAAIGEAIALAPEPIYRAVMSYRDAVARYRAEQSGETVAIDLARGIIRQLQADLGVALADAAALRDRAYAAEGDLARERIDRRLTESRFEERIEMLREALRSASERADRAQTALMDACPRSPLSESVSL